MIELEWPVQHEVNAPESSSAAVGAFTCGSPADGKTVGAAADVIHSCRAGSFRANQHGHETCC